MKAETWDVALDALRYQLNNLEPGSVFYDYQDEVDSIKAAIADIKAMQQQQPNADGLLPCPFCGGRRRSMDVFDADRHLACRVQRLWRAS